MFCLFFGSEASCALNDAGPADIPLVPGLRLAQSRLEKRLLSIADTEQQRLIEKQTKIMATGSGGVTEMEQSAAKLAKLDDPIVTAWALMFLPPESRDKWILGLRRIEDVPVLANLLVNLAVPPGVPENTDFVGIWMLSIPNAIRSLNIALERTETSKPRSFRRSDVEPWLTTVLEEALRDRLISSDQRKILRATLFDISTFNDSSL